MRNRKAIKREKWPSKPTFRYKQKENKKHMGLAFSKDGFSNLAWPHKYEGDIQTGIHEFQYSIQW